MTAPHIKEPTQIEKQYAIEAVKAAEFGENWLVTANRALAIQNVAYQTALGTNEATEQYITAEEARKLGAGKAEYFHDWSNVWLLCHVDCSYYPNFKYRAIKQPEPVEPKICTIKNLDTGIISTMTNLPPVAQCGMKLDLLNNY